jgi:glycosyltransferase involved in cell wall biosynthesis
MDATWPQISVIVPCYNEGSLIQTALRSIQLQSFTNFEVIIGDDCSTDDTAVIASEFCRADSRFRLSCAPQNLGMTANWNRLLRECRGQFVAKLDADDAYQPEILSRLKLTLEEQKLSAAFCRTIDCDAQLRPVGSYYGERAFILKAMEPLDDHVRAGNSWLQMCFDGYQLWHSSAFLVTRELLTAINGWDERWGCAADTDLIHRILHHEKMVAGIGYPGLLYRRRPGSVFNQYKDRNWFKTEVLTILLLSLSRMYESGAVLPSRLQRTWGALWIQRQSSLHELTGEHGKPYAAEVDVPKPPLKCLALHRLRESLATIKRKLI